MSQPDLAAAVAVVLGSEPFTQSLVSAWERADRVPSPTQLIALEKALGLSPGALTHHLGYVPIGAEARGYGVAEAIARDVDLTARQRDELVATWQAMVEATRRSRERRTRGSSNGTPR